MALQKKTCIKKLIVQFTKFGIPQKVDELIPQRIGQSRTIRF